MNSRTAPKLAPKRRRVHIVDAREWKRVRRILFNRYTSRAAKAKGVRTALQVTQREMAESYGVTGPTVCNWESGRYSWPGGDDELSEYVERVRKIAGV